MTFAADYSYWRPTAAQLAAMRGKGFVTMSRYLAHSTGKVLTAPERDELHAVGFAILSNFEDGAQNALGGAAQGQRDAGFANDLADGLAQPHDRPIYYSVDFDATQAQITGPIAAYFRAATAVGRRPVGAYGSAAVVDLLMRMGVISWAWQTVAWSGGQHSALAGLYQENVHTAPMAGVPVSQYDENIVLHADHGQWPAPAAPAPNRPPAPPAPAPSPQRNPGLVRGLQHAWHQNPDGSWGPHTDAAGQTVRAAALGHLPGDVHALQGYVGAKPDGAWGPVSRGCLVSTVRVTQTALGVTPDADWGPTTDAHYNAARAANLVH